MRRRADTLLGQSMASSERCSLQARETENYHVLIIMILCTSPCYLSRVTVCMYYYVLSLQNMYDIRGDCGSANREPRTANLWLVA